MAASLTTCRTQLAQRLQDPSNLIYATSTLDEALRASLAELSSAYGAVVSLDGLDGETSTTFDDADLHSFLVGAHAHALRMRLTGKMDEPNPARENLIYLASLATTTMNEFQALLTHIRMRRFQQSTSHPYSAWEWDEGEDFS